MSAQQSGGQASPAQIAAYLYRVEGMRCNCDLDNWQPEISTGHSCVCRIHRAAIAALAAIGARP